MAVLGPILLALFISTAFSAPAAQSAPAASLRVMTWGTENTPQWDQILHLSGFREGCSDAPQSCMRSLARFARHSNYRVFLAIALKSSTAAAYGQQYSALSLQNPSLEEISLDDFISQYEKLFSQRVSDPPAVLGLLIDGLKSQNHNLHFGITLYEDELTSDYLSDSTFPAALRAKVDYVHLYLHYASHAPDYQTYVKSAKAIFPNASIIAGLYAYDRTSYLPCSPAGPKPCTPQQQIDYFTQSLDSAIQMLRSSRVSWIEFYPGSFGREAEWSGWRDPRVCTGDRQACVATTEQMRQIVAGRFKNLFQ